MTTLPVDYAKAPYRPKYIVEETPVLNDWFIFGESKDGLTVDISDANEDIFVNVPRDVAEKVLKARHDFCKVIEEHFCNFGAKK